MAKSHKSCMKQAEIIDMFGTYQTPILNKFINETPIDLPPFDFIPRSIFIRPLFERPLKTSCTIEELFDDLDDGSINIT